MKGALVSVTMKKQSVISILARDMRATHKAAAAASKNYLARRVEYYAGTMNDAEFLALREAHLAALAAADKAEAAYLAEMQRNDDAAARRLAEFKAAELA